MKEKAMVLAGRLSSSAEKGVAVIGPFKAGIYRLKGVYRWVILIRGEPRAAVRRVFSRGAMPVLLQTTRNDPVRITPDVDPLFMA